MNKKSSFIEYFSNNRNSFEKFYPSERYIFEKIFKNNNNSKVLDIGCACGGLYNALKEKYGNIDYTGIEINEIAANYASTTFPEIKVINSDFNDFKLRNNTKFNYVFSLSCFDWNLGNSEDILASFYTMLYSSWDLVEAGGYLILSLRVDDIDTIFDSKSSYQYINYEGKLEGEIANYGIISIETVQIFKKLYPSKIIAKGFVGSPSKTAITPKKELCFSVFAIQKPTEVFISNTLLDLDLTKKFNSLFKKNYQ